MTSESPKQPAEELVTIELSRSTLMWLDALRQDMGLRSREALISRLLDELAQPANDA